MSDLTKIKNVELTETTEFGTDGESRVNLLKRLNYNEPPFDGDIEYEVAVKDDIAFVLANGHDIGLIKEPLIALKNKSGILEINSKPVIEEKFGDFDVVFYSAEVELIENYESPEQVKKFEKLERSTERGRRIQEGGERIQETGENVAQAGKSITAFVVMLILFVILILFLKTCAF